LKPALPRTRSYVLPMPGKTLKPRATRRGLAQVLLCAVPRSMLQSEEEALWVGARTGLVHDYAEEPSDHDVDQREGQQPKPRNGPLLAPARASVPFALVEGSLGRC